MIEWTDEIKKEYNRVLLMGVFLLICAPPVYLFVAYMILENGVEVQEWNQFIFYAAIVISIVGPLVSQIMEKAQILRFKNSEQTEKELFDLMFKSTLIKLNLVEAIYCYGFIIFFISKDMSYMYYFYPIGIVWTLLYFPTKPRFEALLNRINSHEL